MNVSVPLTVVAPPNVTSLELLIFKFPYVRALTVCAALPAYSTVKFVSVLLAIVYCELKSAVAAVRVTFTVPLPVRVPVPLMMSAAAGAKEPFTVIVPLALKLPLLEIVPLIVKLLNVNVPELLMDPEAPLRVIVPVGEKVNAPTVSVPAIVKLVEGFVVIVTLSVRLFKVKVPLLVIVAAALFTVTVPEVQFKFALALTVRAA